MKHISLIILLCTSFFLSAQNTFFKSFGGTSNDVNSSGNILNTYNKGFLLSGSTYSFGNGGSDGYLICLDYNGNLAWSKNIGGSASDVVSGVISTTNGQVIIAGNYTLNGNNFRNSYTTELDSLGNVVWSKTYGGTSGSDDFTSLRLNSNNELIVTGLSESIQPGGMRDAVAMKLSPTGNVIWSRVFGGSQNDWGRDMMENASGYLFMGNTFSYGAGQHDGLLVQLDNNGNIVWSKTMGTSSEDQFMNMEIANNGDAIIAAFTTSGGGRKGWIQRLNSTGNPIWSKTYSASGYQVWAKIAKANDGNILVFASEVVNPGKLVILKVNENTGNIIWAKEYGGNGRDIAHSYFQTPDGAINVIGQTNSYSAGGDEDLFILRTDANGDMKGCVTLDVKNLFTASNFTNYSTQNITPQQQMNYPSANATFSISNAPTIQNVVCEGIQALFNIQNPVICIGECTNMIDSSIGATSWNWSFQGANITSSSAQNPTNICYNTVGSFDIQLIISNGSAFDTLTKIITVTDIPQIDLGADVTICKGKNLMLDATTNGAAYLWSTGATTPSIQVNTAGTYWVEATIGTCVARDTILVNTFDLPVISLGNDTSFCDVNTFTLNAFNPNFTAYLWQDNSNLDSFVVNNTGDYSVTITDGNGCQTADTIRLNFHNTPDLELGNDTIICQYQTVLLNAFAQDATYFWNDNTTNSTLAVTESGTYIVAISLGACQISDTIKVDVTPTPFIFLGNDTMICEGKTALLSAEDVTATNYFWQDGSSFSSFEVSEAGTYSVFVNYNNGCFNTDTIEFLPELPIYKTLPADTFFCKNMELILNAYQENALSYQWEGASAYWKLNDYQSSQFIVNLEGNYSVIINNGCRDLLQNVSVTKDDCGCYPFIPNAFTPNNDGNNDAFQIYNNCPISNYELRIFDRWGGLAFQSNDINEHWNGTVNGEAVDGVYVWMLTYQTLGSDGKDETRLESGDVTVLR